MHHSVQILKHIREPPSGPPSNTVFFPTYGIGKERGARTGCAVHMGNTLGRYTRTGWVHEKWASPRRIEYRRPCRTKHMNY